jgi:hypothetical protein
LRGLPPDAGENSKRARKSNSHSLEAFSASQTPIIRKQKAKKRPRAESIAEEEVEDAVESTGNVGASKNNPPGGVDEAEATPSRPSKGKGKQQAIDIASSPLPTRKKQFDPTESIGDRLVIIFVVTVEIDGREKLSIPLHDNINSRHRWTLDSMRHKVYTKRVEEWEVSRGLQGADKPKAMPWVATCGDPKKQGICIELDSEDDLRELLVFLRLWNHSGAKWASTVSIKAPWKTYERTRTPSPVLPTSKGKGKSKSQPVNIRRAILQEASSDTPVRTDDDNPSDASPEEEEDLPNTITGKLLKAKRRSEAKEPPIKVTRRAVFGANYCSEARCNNRRGCCYVLKSKGTHHGVSIMEQDEWANAILLKIPGVDFQTPPASWIARYQDGESMTNFKTSGTRKSDQKKEEIAPKKDTGGGEPMHLHINMPPAASVPQPPPPQGYWQQGIGGFQYIAGTPFPPPIGVASPQKPGSSNVQNVALPSSPLRPGLIGENEMSAFHDYLISIETLPARKPLIQAAFERFEEADILSVDQLHDKELIMSSGVKAGTAFLISKHVSTFKLDYKKRLKNEEEAEAARRLLDFRNTGSSSDMRRNMGRSGEEQDADFFDEF